MRYLLDTNIIAEPTKPQPNQLVANRITQHYSEVAIAPPIRQRNGKPIHPRATEVAATQTKSAFAG